MHYSAMILLQYVAEMDTDIVPSDQAKLIARWWLPFPAYSMLICEL